MLFAAVTIASTLLIANHLFPSILACPETCQCRQINEANHVTCSDQSMDRIPEDIPPTVTVLDLHGNNISSLTNVFQNLTRVQHLDLSFNQVNKLHPGNFNFNLENLNISNNLLSVLDGGTFQDLPKLNELNIADNLISTLNTSAFDGLFNLRILKLQGNKISNLTGDVFSSLPSLMRLDLQNNRITDISEETFSSLQNLTEIYLNNNVLTDLHIHSESIVLLNLSNNSIKDTSRMVLPNLEMFDLSWNNLTTLSLDMFQNVNNLSTLILDGNPISFINASVFRHLHVLENLSLKNMPQLSYLSKDTFVCLERLRVLTLRNNPQLSFISKELFLPLKSLQKLDLSSNAISSIYNDSLYGLSELVSIDLSGNNFSCDCAIEWLIARVQSNNSIIGNANKMECSVIDSSEVFPLSSINLELLHCSDVRIVSHSEDSSFKIGRAAVLKCNAESSPVPSITWITPRKRILRYHNFHHLSTIDYLPYQSIQLSETYDKSYYSESDTRDDRIKILSDGSLYISFVMRSDGGMYKCIAENPRNSTEVVILVTLNYSILNEVKIWSIVVGFSCAGGFFLLNLTYSLTLAAVRRCVSQRRRQQIRELIESMDQYKCSHLSRIKENYNHQVGRIRDQYHYQLGRLREHHQTQVSRMGRMKEGASQKVEKIRDNYNNQLGRLKDYSSSQLLQLREKYNSQIDRVKDYGNDKLDRLHEKYKLKQQHVLKLLEMMNFDNCRTVFESECVRAESMILQSEVFTTDVPLHEAIDSISPSDSEYVTATNSKAPSKFPSQENMNCELTECDNGESQSEYSGPINPYLPDDLSDNGSTNLEMSSSYFPCSETAENIKATFHSENQQTNCNDTYSANNKILSQTKSEDLSLVETSFSGVEQNLKPAKRKHCVSKQLKGKISHAKDNHQAASSNEILEENEVSDIIEPCYSWSVKESVV